MDFGGKNQKEIEGGDDDGDVGCWNKGDGGGVVMVEVKMVGEKK